MFSRRTFLGYAGVAAGTSLVTGCVGARTGTESSSKLPPSIANLKSMKDQAKPITADERQARIENARRLMVKERLDALMLTGGTSLNYFAGINWWLSERIFVFVVPARGKPFFVCPAFERDRADEQIARSPLAQNPDLRTWEEDENPYRLLTQGLKDRGIAGGRLGIEETVRFVCVDGVAKAAPGVKIVSGTPVTAGCRMRKSGHEVALMRLAAQVSIKAYASAWRALKPGMDQHEFAGLVAAAHTQLGFPGGADVQVGPYSALPHGSVEPQTIREGVILLMDGGCKVEGYASDISRTFVLGRPAEKMKRVFDIVHQAQATALKTARPGIEAQAVDDAARKVIIDAGYGPDYKYFKHRVGHGMGMDGHEWPYLVRGETTKLEPNMTFSDEPGIYIHGEFGVRLEDDLHILENGAELFTPQSPSLEDPFAGVEA